MKNHRVTFAEGPIAQISSFLEPGSLMVQENVVLTAPFRLEIRNSTCGLYRLSSGATFKIEKNIEGSDPTLSGEVFMITNPSWPKYVTTCYTCRMHGSPPLHLLIRPSQLSNSDEYILLLGNMVIHDFDERGRHFLITDLNEGEKATVTYDPAIAAGPRRYSSKKEPISNAEYDDILARFIDPRQWI
jgi:hypothetical protein